MDKRYIIIIILIVIILYCNKNNIIKLFNIVKLFLKTKKINDNILHVNSINNEKLKKTSKILEFLNKKLDDNINKNINNTNILEITKYAFSGGKKIRPLIFMIVYNMLNKNPCDSILLNDKIINIALFIEYIHSGSLILDDIMDKDCMRRGIESVHIKYGENISMLVSIMIVSYGVNLLFDSIKDINDNNKSMFIGNFISNMIKDLSYGQYMDIKSCKENNFDINQLILKKTSILFQYSFVIPYILSTNKTNIEMEDVDNMKKCGNLFGLIFQITDDFEDYYNDIIKSDNNKNYIIKNGKEVSYMLYNNYVNIFKNKIKNLNLENDVFTEIINYMTNKVDYYYNVI
jgi:geranylgeranyl pyrophosphate synthase